MRGGKKRDGERCRSGKSGIGTIRISDASYCMGKRLQTKMEQWRQEKFHVERVVSFYLPNEKERERHGILIDIPTNFDALYINIYFFFYF